MIKRKIIVTADGSTTLFDSVSGEHYHSMNGAITESMHVFIENGLKPAMLRHQKLKVLEYGFGTGLNALLTFQHLQKLDVPCEYTTLEAFPLNEYEIRQLNFWQKEPLSDLETIFLRMHDCDWNSFVQIDINFSIRKLQLDFRNFNPESLTYNLVYFDAFSPSSQAELWTTHIFEKIYKSLDNNGIFVTYSASGLVKRALREAGFRVKRLPGPPGKRHMLFATKENPI